MSLHSKMIRGPLDYSHCFFLFCFQLGCFPFPSPWDCWSVLHPLICCWFLLLCFSLTLLDSSALSGSFFIFSLCWSSQSLYTLLSNLVSIFCVCVSNFMTIRLTSLSGILIISTFLEIWCCPFIWNMFPYVLILSKSLCLFICIKSATPCCLGSNGLV